MVLASLFAWLTAFRSSFFLGCASYSFVLVGSVRSSRPLIVLLFPSLRACLFLFGVVLLALPPPSVEDNLFPPLAWCYFPPCLSWIVLLSCLIFGVVFLPLRFFGVASSNLFACVAVKICR